MAIVPKSRELQFLTPDSQVVKSYPSVPNQPKDSTVPEAIFDFTGHETCFLWNRGGGTLTIVRPRTASVEDLSQFWLNKSKIKLLTPISAIVDKKSTQIVALALDEQHNSFHFIFQEAKQNGQREFVPSSKLIPGQIDDPSGFEISLCQKYVYFGGSKSSIATIVCLEFNSTLNLTCCKKFPAVNAAKVHKIKRIEGSEILVLGCQGIIIVGMFSANKANFDAILTIKDMSSSDIHYFSYCKNHIVVVDQSTGIIRGVQMRVNNMLESLHHVEYENDPGLIQETRQPSSSIADLLIDLFQKKASQKVGAIAELGIAAETFQEILSTLPDTSEFVVFPSSDNL